MIQGRSDPCFLKWPSQRRSWNRYSPDQPRFFQSSIVQYWWACVNCRHAIHFSARVQQKGSLGRVTAFSDGPCFGSSDDCPFWPLTSGINTAFHTTPQPLTGYSLSFGLTKISQLVVCQNPSRPAVCEMLRPTNVASTTLPPVMASNLLLSNYTSVVKQLFEQQSIVMTLLLMLN